MPKPKCTSSSDDGNNKNNKKRKQQDLASSFFSGNTELQKKTLLLLQHKGKPILIKAVDIYGSRKKVPTGEEGYLLLYCITAIKDDCKTATIEYEQKAIKEDLRDCWLLSFVFHINLVHVNILISFI
jgi:hypothetical protein